MSQKRKLEEYHDPDYPQLIAPKRICAENLDEKLQRIHSIIIREFEQEMLTKEKEILEIDHRIVLIKKLLHQVRYAVVSQYYNKKNLIINPEEVNLPSILENDPIKGKQSAIHPSLKKILGTKLKDYDELLKIRSPRQAAKTAQSTIKEKLKTTKEKRLERLKMEASTTISQPITETTTSTNYLNSNKIQEIEEQNSFSINSNLKWQKPIAILNEARGGNYIRQLIVVGNTSKYIGFEKSTDNVTHKWLIYVQSKTPSTIPIEQYIRKIRFFLHPSYKPNDIIDVNCTPFHLSRRGWGEFPVRLQLFFHSQLQQKPVQLVHNLILDKKLTGLQTLGAETLVEIWLRSNFIKPAETITKKEYEGNISMQNDSDNIKDILLPTTTIEKNLLEFLEKIESPSISSDIDNIEPSLLLSPNQHFNISELMTPKIKSQYNDIEFNLAENLGNSNSTTTEEIKPIPSNIKEINNKLNDLGICGVTSENHINIIKPDNNNLLQNVDETNIMNRIKQKCSKSNKNNIFFKNGKMYIIDPLQAKLRLKQKNIQQESLLKPQISLLKSNVKSDKIPIKTTNINYNPLNNDHDYTPKRNNLKEIPNNIKECNTNIKKLNKNSITTKKNICLMQKSNFNYRQEYENEFFSLTFTNCTNAINYLFKKVPLINQLAIHRDYRISFPFVVRNYDIYQKYNTPKRRSNEWLQSKYFSQLLKQHNQFKDTFWTTKEIILYARSHAYTPLITQADLYALNNLLNTDIQNDEQQIDSNSTNDFCNLNDINNWIKEKLNIINNKNIKKESDEIIDILNENDICIKNEKNIIPVKDCSYKFWLPLEEKYEDEATLISNISFEIGLRLHPEEIQLGVMHESVKLVMIRAMRSFIEEIIRKSNCKQYEEDSPSSMIECRHIKAAITSQSRFDFLTNQYFYITENIKEEEMTNK